MAGKDDGWRRVEQETLDEEEGAEGRNVKREVKWESL